jgi:chromosome segregation protein
LRFNRLRLNGFKSFVDPTDLIIHEGLTGVVGPNGCGKSNLLEALRWVMGENRPTAMRGGGMEDVIFAGTASRPARNFAEVALVIDNQDRLAPSGFNEADTIEITRRITRDAGSAYKANTRDVRARDIQMLIADASTGAFTGLGAAGPDLRADKCKAQSAAPYFGRSRWNFGPLPAPP